MRLALVFAAIVFGLIVPASTADGEPLPVFDTHMHYSRNSWDAVPPETALGRMQRAGVVGALVSSTPDEGTSRLHAAAPGRIVPFLRPYRGAVSMTNWTADPELFSYIETRLAKGGHRGIGEVHLPDMPRAADAPAVRRLAAFAAERGLVLHLHTGADPIRALLRAVPDLVILWAHAGFDTPAQEVGAMLDRHPRLLAELSFRAEEIGSGEGLDPAWREVLLRHPDRFMVGTDTYIADRWAEYEALVEAHRVWLRQLPRNIAEAIAYANAERVFGSTRR